MYMAQINVSAPQYPYATLPRPPTLTTTTDTLDCVNNRPLPSAIMNPARCVVVTPVVYGWDTANGRNIA